MDFTDLIYLLIVIPLWAFWPWVTLGLAFNVGVFVLLRKTRLASGIALFAQTAAVVLPCLFIGLFVDDESFGHVTAFAVMAAFFLLTLNCIILGLLDSLWRKPK